MTKQDEPTKGPPILPKPPHPSEPQRRVYALPQEMVDRIVEFQREKGYPSEVEAVRRLLDDALKSRDNLEKIVNRYLSKLEVLKVTAEAAREVLVGHPLVKSVQFDDDDDVTFYLKSGAGASIYESGYVRIISPKGENWTMERDRESPYSPITVDEVPF